MINNLRIIDFMGVRHYTSALSIIFIVISLGALTVNGLKLGLDFTGGTQLDVKFDRPADLDLIREVLEAEELVSPVAVLFGSDTEVMIRTQDQMRIKATEKLTAHIATLGPAASLDDVERPAREYETYADALVIANVSLE